MKEAIPLLLEVKSNSLDDGPGIRSVVFFKGCPLRCIWCHNPESKRVGAEISYDRKECIGCGTCVKNCPAGALDPADPAFIDRAKCTLCFTCTENCPAKAITRVGKEPDREELLRKLLSDKPFYDVSGGGVTLSGGEATLFAAWVGDLAKDLRERGVRVLLETCGYFDYPLVREKLLPYVNDIYCDIKIFDAGEHKRLCGVDNARILENFRRMQEDSTEFGYTLLPRTPLIPGLTDTEENLTAIAAFLRECGVSRAQLLPYNPTWYGKNDKLGITLAPELEGATAFQTKEQVNSAQEIFRSHGIEC